MSVLAGSAAAQEFSLTQSDILPNQMIGPAQVFNQYGCQGQNISPAVAWQNVPEGTQSIAVTLFDRDAKDGDGFWHWVAVNLPADTTGLAAGAADTLPQGARNSVNDFGQRDYDGPCPPPGQPHHYELAVWALNVPALPYNFGVSGQALKTYLSARAVGMVSVTGVYGR